MNQKSIQKINVKKKKKKLTTIRKITWENLYIKKKASFLKRNTLRVLRKKGGEAEQLNLQVVPYKASTRLSHSIGTRKESSQGGGLFIAIFVNGVTASIQNIFFSKFFPIDSSLIIFFFLNLHFYSARSLEKNLNRLKSPLMFTL